MDSYSARYDIIRKAILEWRDNNPRDLPWKKDNDPYKIWISEIILQQTRVAQGKSYYKRFINRFPTIHHLADTPIEEVLKIWQGLGYYSRVKNLHETAKQLVTHNRGKIPSEYCQLLKLKGIGPYTASAISSFAFNKPRAVVDGNVIRVLTRIFGIEDNTQSAKTKNKIQNLADRCICPDDPGSYNQAIMDFGAMVCRPSTPDCNACPLTRICSAHLHGKTQQIPCKRKPSPKTERHFQFFLIREGKKIVLQQRGDGDIWPLLYQFPLNEQKRSMAKLNLNPLKQILRRRRIQVQIRETSEEYKQVLSHQIIFARFYQIMLPFSLQRKDLKEGYLLEEIKNLSNFAFPKIIDCYLKDKLIYLRD